MKKTLLFKKKNDISHALEIYKVKKKVTLNDIKNSIEQGYLNSTKYKKSSRTIK